jgi:hypothetical protein
LNLQKVDIGDVIYLEWEDSALAGDGWHYHQVEPKPKLIQTVGFVIDKSDDAIVLACSKSGTHGIMAPLIIPVRCITGYKVLAA